MVGKGIYWELCKNWKFDHTSKWNTPKLESVHANKTYKLLWNFQVQTDHLTSARKLDWVIINKKKKKWGETYRIVDFAVLADHRWIIKENKETNSWILAENKKRQRNLWLTIILIMIGGLRTVHKRLVKGLEELDTKSRAGTIKTTALLRSAKILGQSPGNLRGLAGTQTLVKDHQLALV